MKLFGFHLNSTQSQTSCLFRENLIHFCDHQEMFGEKFDVKIVLKFSLPPLLPLH